jgi:rhodanese-related sulfurtransferase
MCGRNISTDRNSTIGRERRTNYALQPMEREAFVALMTEDLPPRPEYFQRDVDYNRRGAAALESLPPLTQLAPQAALELQRGGAAILDTRAATPFCSGHVPASINIGLSGQFAAWAGAVLGLDRDLILVSDDENAAEEARMRLARVGIERVVGAVAGGIAGWAEAGLPLAITQQITVQDLSPETNHFAILDVRRPPEWKSGHIPGARLEPLDGLTKTLDELDRKAPVAVNCKGGYRSAVACSLLEAAGFEHVVNVIGGFDAWAAAGLPVEGSSSH